MERNGIEDSVNYLVLINKVRLLKLCFVITNISLIQINQEFFIVNTYNMVSY